MSGRKWKSEVSGWLEQARWKITIWKEELSKVGKVMDGWSKQVDVLWMDGSGR